MSRLLLLLQLLRAQRSRGSILSPPLRLLGLRWPHPHPPMRGLCPARSSRWRFRPRSGRRLCQLSPPLGAAHPGRVESEVSLLPGHVGCGDTWVWDSGAREGSQRSREDRGAESLRTNVTLTYKWRHCPLETVTPGHGGCLSRGLGMKRFSLPLRLPILAQEAFQLGRLDLRPRGPRALPWGRWARPLGRAPIGSAHGSHPRGGALRTLWASVPLFARIPVRYSPRADVCEVPGRSRKQGARDKYQPLLFLSAPYTVPKCPHLLRPAPVWGRRGKTIPALQESTI